VIDPSATKPRTRMKKIYVGVARLGLHIPEARSLKAKRSHTRSLA
jgi:hypothetical protein